MDPIFDVARTACRQFRPLPPQTSSGDSEHARQEFQGQPGGSSASVLLINTRPGPSRLAPVTGVGFWSTGKMGSRLANRDLLQVQIAAPRHCKGCSSARCPFARISIRPWVGPCPGAPLRASVCVSFSLSLSLSLSSSQFGSHEPERGHATALKEGPSAPGIDTAPGAVRRPRVTCVHAPHPSPWTPEPRSATFERARSLILNWGSAKACSHMCMQTDLQACVQMPTSMQRDCRPQT